MKSISSNPGDYNIYCTDADSIHHSLSSVRANQLLRQIKTCSLLGEHVYISGGHIYENPETVNLLIKNPDLLQSGIVVIGLRDDCRDFDDLLEMQKSLGKSLIPNHASLPGFLNNNTSFVMRWSAPKTQPRFKRFLLNSIENPESTLRRRLRVGVAKSTISELYRELQDLDPKMVTREFLQHLIGKHIPHHRKAFMREVNLLYYIAGSSDRIPHLSQSLFWDLRHGYIESLDHEKYPIPAEGLFEDLLRQALVSVDVIDRITVCELADFRERYSDYIKRFRRKWWYTIGISDPSVSGSCTPPDIQELQSLISEEMMSEKTKLRKYNTAARSISITSLAISCASVFATNPVIGAISFLISCGAFAAEADRIKHKVLGTHFSALTSCLRSSCMAK